MSDVPIQNFDSVLFAANLCFYLPDLIPQGIQCFFPVEYVQFQVLNLCLFGCGEGQQFCFLPLVFCKLFFQVAPLLLLYGIIVRGEVKLHSLDFLFVLFVPFGLFCLTVQRIPLAGHLRDDIPDTRKVVLRPFQFAEGFIFSGLVFGDTGGLFK